MQWTPFFVGISPFCAIICQQHALLMQTTTALHQLRCRFEYDGAPPWISPNLLHASVAYHTAWACASQQLRWPSEEATPVACEQGVNPACAKCRLITLNSGFTHGGRQIPLEIRSRSCSVSSVQTRFFSECYGSAGHIRGQGHDGPGRTDKCPWQSPQCNICN